MNPDQLARAAAALDVWFDPGPGGYRAPGCETYDHRQLESMHAALEAPTIDAALEAFEVAPGSWLSTPEQDAWNRATMIELREALREPESQAEAPPGEPRPSRQPETGTESPDREGISQLRAYDAGLTGDPGCWVQPIEVYWSPRLDPRSPEYDPEFVDRVEWEAGPYHHEHGADTEFLAGAEREAGPGQDAPDLEPW
jgi:hypothetical protein